MDTATLQRTLMRNAALLLFLGLLTGLFVAGAMTGKLDADAHAALASHLNALLGCFWMTGVAFSLPMLRYGARGQTWLVWLTTIPNFANWIVTALKSSWHVAGVDATGNAKNDVIFGLLNAFVVIPSLTAAGMWLYGFRKAASTQPGTH